MKLSPIMKLKSRLLRDSDYVKFEKTYNENEIIDKELLIKLLDKHLDLYNIFLKFNIFLYNFDIKELNEELQDFLHYKGTDYYLRDLNCILNFYYSHYPMFIRCINEIIDNKLRPQSEINLLEKIINNSIEKKQSNF